VGGFAFGPQMNAELLSSVTPLIKRESTNGSRRKLFRSGIRIYPDSVESLRKLL
jgi:hypothetical protein